MCESTSATISTLFGKRWHLAAHRWHDDNRNVLLVRKRMDVRFVEKEVLVDGVRYLEGGRAYRQLRHLRGPKVRHAPFCHPCLAPNPPLGLLHACLS